MLRLFVNYYVDADSTRQSELDEAWKINLGNRHIHGTVVLQGRPTYQDFFEKVNSTVNVDDISIIANSDVYFDHTIERVWEMSSKQCYALSRWDVGREAITLFNRRDSQDAWVFRGKIRPVNHCDFITGKRGCDNAIAARLADAGYEILNPSKTIRALHLHQTGLRRYGHMPADFVPRPYLLVNPIVSGENQQYARVE